ncbi:xylose isomerase [Luteitalea sp. TBR-22]|uniref:sugar phosphate isomerase/epimerase family protein n=1 Tax=Luteitalea sp. TBR-22 TaxID=2802971 RepID=UPI001AF8A96A|nr:sugar phosphate isomerase/epimerase family protein [Luteitalea sp. TBR-22]BCS35375.1 xylose isomerase [Luteitalea sp. TBR-22]
MPMPLNRRAFLSATASAAVASTFTAAPVVAAPIRRAGKTQLRVGLAAYSMRQYLTAKPGTRGAMDLLGLIDYAATLGVDAVELTSYFFPEKFDRAYLNEVKRRCHVNGLDISGGAIRNNFTLPDEDPELQKWLQHTDTWLGHYAVLGAPVVRVFSGVPPKGMSEEQGIANGIKNLKKALVYAEKHGVILGLENHDYLTKIDRMLPALKEIDSPWFGVNLDSGNVDDTDVYPQLQKIVPYAVNVQLKVETGPVKQKVPTDVPRFVKLLKDAGYRGYVVLEYESAPDPYEAIPQHLASLRDAIHKA